MSDQMKKLDAYKKEGSEKFAKLNAAGNAVRNFAHMKRESSADEYDDKYDADRVNRAVLSTVEQSVDQSAEVYKMFANSEDMDTEEQIKSNDPV